VSMATAHLAVGSSSYHVLHAALWIDGAVGFVFLAGLMLGRTQRRISERSGPSAARLRVLSRIGIVYAGHLFICVIAVVAVAVNPVRAGPYTGLTELGGPVPALGSLVLLQVNPRNASILSLYVVLLALALVAVALLRRGGWRPVLGTSVLLYGAGTLWPQAFSFPVQPGVGGQVNWASWQLLFAVALVLGWHWSVRRVQRLLVDRTVLGVATTVTVALIGWAWLTVVSPPHRPTSVVRHLFSEGTLGPGTIVMALGAGLVLYRGVARLADRGGRWLRPLALLGRHSLPCYLILSVLVIAAPLLVQYRRDSGVGNAAVLGFLAMCWTWCALRERARRRDTADIRHG
jgi:hypothetical protein